jgi:ABC-type multidrug transport system fused ATPase/permease subunit
MFFRMCLNTRIKPQYFKRAWQFYSTAWGARCMHFRRNMNVKRCRFSADTAYLTSVNQQGSKWQVSQESDKCQADSAGWQFGHVCDKVLNDINRNTFYRIIIVDRNIFIYMLINVLSIKITNPINLNLGPSVAALLYISRLLNRMENTKWGKEFFPLSVASAQEFKQLFRFQYSIQGDQEHMPQKCVLNIKSEKMC